MSEGRILIVDDDAQLRRVLRVSLTAQGYEVGDVRSGEEATSNARSERYELVLLDINLPIMNGIDVCRALRSRPHGSELAIIMLSVRNTEADKIEALNAGADDYVAKPSAWRSCWHEFELHSGACPWIVLCKHFQSSSRISKSTSLLGALLVPIGTCDSRRRSSKFSRISSHFRAALSVIANCCSTFGEQTTVMNSSI